MGVYEAMLFILGNTLFPAILAIINSTAIYFDNDRSKRYDVNEKRRAILYMTLICGAINAVLAIAFAEGEYDFILFYKIMIYFPILFIILKVKNWLEEY